MGFVAVDGRGPCSQTDRPKPFVRTLEEEKRGTSLGHVEAHPLLLECTRCRACRNAIMVMDSPALFMPTQPSQPYGKTRASEKPGRCRPFCSGQGREGDRERGWRLHNTHAHHSLLIPCPSFIPVPARHTLVAVAVGGQGGRVAAGGAYSRPPRRRAS